MHWHGTSDRFTKTRFYDPEKLDFRYTAPLPRLPDLPSIRQDIESFREGIKIMEEYMGRLIYALHHGGYDGDTLVIVKTDHGAEFPSRKKTLSDQGPEVMLMIRGPENRPAASAFCGGRVIEPMVTQLDHYPTICDLLGLSVPHPMEGKCLFRSSPGKFRPCTRQSSPSKLITARWSLCAACGQSATNTSVVTIQLARNSATTGHPPKR